MVEKIIHEYEKSNFDFTKFVCPDDPAFEYFGEWKDYYKLKFAISKVIKPTSILEIGVRFGYSASAFLTASPKASFLGIDINDDSFGGEIGALNWARQCLSQFDVEFLVANSQDMQTFPGGRYDLIHIDGQQDDGGTFHDLSLAITQSKWILVDGYFWTKENFRESNEFLLRYKELIQFSFSIPGYAGELLIRAKDHSIDSTFPMKRKTSYYLRDYGMPESLEMGLVRTENDVEKAHLFSLISLEKKGSRLLEVGCCNGNLSLVSALHGYNCTGLDNSKDGISKLTEQQKQFPALKNSLRYVHYEVENFHPQNKFDIIILSGIEGNLFLDNQSTLYKIVSSCLSSKGIVIIYKYKNLWYQYYYSQKRRMIQNLGGYLPYESRTPYEKLINFKGYNPRLLKKILKKHFSEILLWFNSPGNALGNLFIKSGHKKLSSFENFCIIASNKKYNKNKVKKSFSYKLLNRNDVRKLIIKIIEYPKETQASNVIKVMVEVKNLSKYTIHSLPPHPVNLSYHWLDLNTRKTIIYDGLRTSFNFPLSPGSSQNLEANCQVPLEVGEYILRFTLVQEHHAWFDQAPFKQFADVAIKTLK